MTEHTESNLLICPECNEPFDWNDSVLFVEGELLGTKVPSFEYLSFQ